MALQLNLEVEEINTILRVLGKHPFDEVVALIGKIKAQGDQQLALQAQAQQAEAPDPVTSADAPADAVNTTA